MMMLLDLFSKIASVTGFEDGFWLLFFPQYGKPYSTKQLLT